MAIHTFTTTQPKRFETARPGRIHRIGVNENFVCTQEWIDANPSDGGDSDLYIAANHIHGPDGEDMVLENPIAYIKAVAEEIQQDAAGEAFYDKRVTVKLGTLDEKIVGAGWTKIATGTSGTVKDVWWLEVFMDEADHMEGKFDYVELEDDGDDCAVLCYEYVY